MRDFINQYPWSDRPSSTDDFVCLGVYYAQPDSSTKTWAWRIFDGYCPKTYGTAPLRYFGYLTSEEDGQQICADVLEKVAAPLTKHGAC